MSEPGVYVWTAGDGYEWKYRLFEPGEKPHGDIVILHGIQSHGGWYQHTAQWLARRGWRVSLLDRRGSGMNDRDRGDCPSFRRLLDDIAEYVQPLRGEQRKLVLMGISWGGKLAVAFQKRHRDLCSGIVLVAPGLRPQVRPPLWDRLRILFRRFRHPTETLPIPLSDPELFTANQEQQQFIRRDPLALHEATVRLLFESRRLDIYSRLSARRVKIPTLLLLAGRDRIINNRRTRRFVARFRGPVSIIEYPTASHTLDFEPAGPPYLEDLAGWLGRI